MSFHDCSSIWNSTQNPMSLHDCSSISKSTQNPMSLRDCSSSAAEEQVTTNQPCWNPLTIRRPSSFARGEETLSLKLSAAWPECANFIFGGTRPEVKLEDANKATIVTVHWVTGLKLTLTLNLFALNYQRLELQQSSRLKQSRNINKTCSENPISKGTFCRVRSVNILSMRGS